MDLRHFCIITSMITVVLIATTSYLYAQSEDERKDFIASLHKEALKEQDYWTAIQLDAYSSQAFARAPRLSKTLGSGSLIYGNAVGAFPSHINHVWRKSDGLIVHCSQHMFHVDFNGCPTRLSHQLPFPLYRAGVSSDGSFVGGVDLQIDNKTPIINAAIGAWGQESKIVSHRLPSIDKLDRVSIRRGPVISSSGSSIAFSIYWRLAQLEKAAAFIDGTFTEISAFKQIYAMGDKASWVYGHHIAKGKALRLADGSFPALSLVLIPAHY